MAFSRRTGRSRFTLVLLILASITLLTLDYRDSGPVSGLRNVASSVFSPVRSAGRAVGRPFANAWDGAAGHDQLKKKNEQLQRRIDQFEGEKIENDVARREVASLKQQLVIKQASDIPTVAAHIVSGPLTSFEATMEIDRGSGDGVKKGMAVVTQAGLVGRIARVTGGRSTVALITDPSYRFGIRLARQGDLGVASGAGQADLITVNDIGSETEVRKGDAVVTSGQVDSPFPSGIAVGRVVSARLSGDRTAKILLVSPVANLKALTYVTVYLCDENCA